VKRVVIATLIVVALSIAWLLYERRKPENKLRTGGAAIIRQAIEDYAAEHHVYPAARSVRELKSRLVRKDGTPLPIRDAFGMPSELSTRDPWFRPWIVDVSDLNYSIRSFGADGKPDRDPPRGAMVDSESADRDTIIVDGPALQHLWNWGGGGDQGGGGSVVALDRGADAGKIILDWPVDVMRDGKVLASLHEAPSRFQGTAGEYQVRVRLSGSDQLEHVAIERGKVVHKSIPVVAATITAREGPEPWRRPWFAGLLLLNPRAEVWQDDRLITSDCGDCEFLVAPGRYRFVLRDDTRTVFDETRDLKDGDLWIASAPPGQTPRDGTPVGFTIDVPRYRYAYPAFTLKGAGVQQRNAPGYDGRLAFPAPAGNYQLWAALSDGPLLVAGGPLVPVAWGDVHVSVEGLIEIHSGGVAGLSAVVRNNRNVVARTERFPDAFFLRPGHYSVDLLKDGRILSSKNVAVTAKSEQWVALQH
jgi:hypothetical protein